MEKNSFLLILGTLSFCFNDWKTGSEKSTIKRFYINCGLGHSCPVSRLPVAHCCVAHPVQTRLSGSHYWALWEQRRQLHPVCLSCLLIVVFCGWRNLKQTSGRWGFIFWYPSPPPPPSSLMMMWHPQGDGVWTKAAAGFTGWLTSGVKLLHIHEQTAVWLPPPDSSSSGSVNHTLWLWCWYKVLPQLCLILFVAAAWWTQRSCCLCRGLCFCQQIFGVCRSTRSTVWLCPSLSLSVPLCLSLSQSLPSCCLQS